VQELNPENIKASDIINSILKNAKFKETALEIFKFQKTYNSEYARWLNLLGSIDQNPQNLVDIPFLPISLFKHHKISCYPDHELCFESSSTTGKGISKHYIHRKEIYEKSFISTFNYFYNEYWDFVGALLPSYLDRSNSGLVYMVNSLIPQIADSGEFFNKDYSTLVNVIENKKIKKQKVLLFGVTFGLLELAKISGNRNWEHLTVIETGGMKGHGEEMVREDVHDELKTVWNLDYIHSEYGMTELTSQAYSLKDGIFHSPPWMQILIQDPGDPSSFLPCGKTGRVCVIDLMNFHSCSFIATDDLGKLYEDGSFEILGRMDYSDIRGCNQLLQ